MPTVSIVVFSFYVVTMLLLNGVSGHDLRTHTIPDRFNYCLLIWVVAGHGLSLWPVSLRAGLAAAASVCAVILAADMVYIHFRSVPVMGGGDLKLLSIAALAMGFDRTMLALAAGHVLAFLRILIRALSHRPCHMRDRLPMGPFLCAGLVIIYCLYQ